jgi:hypothetical protein
MSEELKKALESLKDYRMSHEEIEAQRISFVYGNAPEQENGTKESVRRSIDMAEFA